MPEPVPTLVDPGPATTLGALEAALGRQGVQPADVQRICLTHVHLDHAGATGAWVQRYPHVRVTVHEEGAGHLVDPDRLVASTRRTFGDAHDRLWGDVTPLSAAVLDPWTPEAANLEAFRVIPTPGHIRHHLAYLHESSGVLLAGDALGIVLAPGAPTHPATPPPGVQVDVWRDTLDELKSLGPERVGVAHFGLHPFADRADQMRAALDALTARVRDTPPDREEAERARFAVEALGRQASHRPREEVERYFSTFRPESDWDGVRFWADRQGRG